MGDLWRDVRYALRMLRRAPAFTAVAVGTLALGFGANAAIFSLLQTLVWKPLPFRDPSRLVIAWDSYAPQFPKIGVSPVELAAWSRERDLLAETAWFRYVSKDLTLAAPGREAMLVHGDIVSTNLFAMLGAAPAVGRGFSEQEPPDSVLIGDRLWRTRFSSDPAIAGRTIRLNEQTVTVIGVMPASFRLPDWADLWLPPGPLLGDEATNPVRHALGFVARLAPGAALAQANARLQAISARLAAQHPKTSTGWGVAVTALPDDLTASVRPALWMLAGAVALVLLIACANVASLLLGRASGRAREIAVRTAIGAGAWRIARQMLTESVLLAMIGEALGIVLAKEGLEIFSPGHAAIDGTVLLALLAAAAGTGIAFGLAPAIEALASDPYRSIQRHAAPGSARFW